MYVSHKKKDSNVMFWNGVLDLILWWVIRSSSSKTIIACQKKWLKAARLSNCTIFWITWFLRFEDLSGIEEQQPLILTFLENQHQKDEQFKASKAACKAAPVHHAQKVDDVTWKKKEKYAHGSSSSVDASTLPSQQKKCTIHRNK